MLKTIPFWLFTLGLVGLYACRGPSPAVAQVGDTTITTQDLAYHQALISVRSGVETPAHLALFQLIETALMAEVGHQNGVIITDKMLAEEAARVQAESRDPVTLAHLRAVFGKNEAAYHRLVLAPILVNQMLQAQFSLSHEIHAEPLARAHEALASAQANPSALEELAEVFGGEYHQLEIVAGQIQTKSPLDIEIPTLLTEYDLELPDYDQEFVEKVLADLEIGELHPQVVEDRHSFMVVRLLSRQGETVIVETLMIPKLAFDLWFQTHTQRIALQINDQVLKDALLAEVEVSYITDRLTVE